MFSRWFQLVWVNTRVLVLSMPTTSNFCCAEGETVKAGDCRFRTAPQCSSSSSSPCAAAALQEGRVRCCVSWAEPGSARFALLCLVHSACILTRIAAGCCTAHPLCYLSALWFTVFFNYMETSRHATWILLLACACCWHLFSSLTILPLSWIKYLGISFGTILLKGADFKRALINKCTHFSNLHHWFLHEVLQTSASAQLGETTVWCWSVEEVLVGFSPPTRSAL